MEKEGTPLKTAIEIALAGSGPTKTVRPLERNKERDLKSDKNYEVPRLSPIQLGHLIQTGPLGYQSHHPFVPGDFGEI